MASTLAKNVRDSTAREARLNPHDIDHVRAPRVNTSVFPVHAHLAEEPASALLARIRAERAARDAVKKPRGRQAKEAA